MCCDVIFHFRLAFSFSSILNEIALYYFNWTLTYRDQTNSIHISFYKTTCNKWFDAHQKNILMIHFRKMDVG